MRGLPARGIFFLGAMGLGPGQLEGFVFRPPNKKKCKTQNVNLKMENIPQSVRVAGSLASRQVSIVPIRAKFWGFSEVILLING